MKEEQILHMFPDKLRERFWQIAKKVDELQEIRFATQQPVRVICGSREFFLNQTGTLSAIIGSNCWYISTEEMEQIFNHLCSYSRYAYEEDIRQGFLTVPGGHRIGLSGQVIPGENGKIRNMKYIRYMNIRIAHEIKGAADILLPYVYKDGSPCNTLLIAPPGCGKTTMLRDLIRQISGGSRYAEGCQVGVVDERSEIAGSYMGVPGNQLGIRTDVLDACPKVYGMMLLVRSMAPEVIAVDEIGGREDMDAIRTVMGCGCKVIATVHGDSREDIWKREIDDQAFERFAFLKKREGKCVLYKVCDSQGEVIYAA